MLIFEYLILLHCRCNKSLPKWTNVIAMGPLMWTQFRWDVSLLNKHAMIPTYQNSHHKIHKSRNKKNKIPGTYSGCKQNTMCFMKEILSYVHVRTPLGSMFCLVCWKFLDWTVDLGLPLRWWCDVASPEFLMYILLYKIWRIFQVVPPKIASKCTLDPSHLGVSHEVCTWGNFGAPRIERHNRGTFPFLTILNKKHSKRFALKEKDNPLKIPPKHIYIL